MFNRDRVIRVDTLKKELSDIKLTANDITIPQKAVKLSHLTEQSLKKRLAAKRKDLMLSLMNVLSYFHDQREPSFALSLKLYSVIVSYQFFKKTIPLEIRNDPFEKHLLKLTEKLLRAESARKNNLKFKWE